MISGGGSNVQQQVGINSFHRFSSNLITERFDEETRVLVERNFPQATELGPTVVAIDGAATSGGAVSCISDPSKTNSFVCHDNSDNFIVYNQFKLGFLQESFNILSFRPDQDPPPLEDNLNPTPEQFEPLLGFSGNAGNRPGYRPGQVVSLADFAPLETFLYKVTNKSDFIIKHPDIPEGNITEITFTQTDDKIIIPVSQAYHGRLDLSYTLDIDEENDEILILLKAGEAIEGAVDKLRINGSVLRVDLRWMRGDTIEITGPRIKDITVKGITVLSVDADKSADFLTDPTPHSVGSVVPFNDRIVRKDLFFHSATSSISSDKKSLLFIFFDDDDGGISVVSSNNFGLGWHYYYGIVEPIAGNDVEFPFCVTHFKGDACFLFFLYLGSIFCKKVPFSSFHVDDANLIERFDDRFTPGNEEEGILPKEAASIYSGNGEVLRRKTLSYMAAGELSGELLRVLGINSDGQLEPFETREIESIGPNGAITQNVKVRKQPVVRGPMSGFANLSINSLFFSAYRNDKGIMRLWYLNEVESEGSDEVGSGGGGIQLQCHYSVDDGINWFDLWENVAFGLNRMRFDETSGIGFIDKSADGNILPAELEGTFPSEQDDLSAFGINVHWSRLKRHKVEEGTIGPDSESVIIDIDSPYLFYQSTTDKVFLFYVYQNCLLCKIFNDNIFRQAAEMRNTQDPKQAGMVMIKSIIERSTRSHFVDGHLNQPELLSELHDRYNAETDERLIDGNIIFPYQFAVEKFDEDRTVFAQRVCAHDLPSGTMRVYYKFRGSTTLKSALWTGREFWAEDFLKDSSIGEFEFPEPQGGNPVTGGFGDEAF